MTERSTTGFKRQIKLFGDFCVVRSQKPAKLPMISGPFEGFGHILDPKLKN